MAVTRLQHLYDLVKPRLEAAVPRLLVGYGPKDFADESRSPRVIWCKSTGDILPTDRAGGNPRPIVRRQVRVVAHLWGDDDGQVDDLIEETIRAVDAVAGGAWAPVEEAWPWHDKPAGLRGGAYAVLTFEATVYVESRPTKTAKATAVAITPTVLPAVDDGT